VTSSRGCRPRRGIWRRTRHADKRAAPYTAADRRPTNQVSASQLAERESRPTRATSSRVSARMSRLTRQRCSDGGYIGIYTPHPPPPKQISLPYKFFYVVTGCFFFSLTQDRFDIVPVCALARVSFPYLHTTIYTPLQMKFLATPLSRGNCSRGIPAVHSIKCTAFHSIPQYENTTKDADAGHIHGKSFVFSQVDLRSPASHISPVVTP